MVLDWIFQKRCLGCRKSGEYLCFSCRKNIEGLRDQYCPACEKKSINGQTHFACKKKFSLDGIFSLFSYQSLVSKIIFQFKYRRVREIKHLLAELIAERLKKHPLFLYWQRQGFVFLPVPLYFTRKLWRGFNQSEEILSLLSRELKLDFNKEILLKRKWTKAQVGLDAFKRRKNVISTFCCFKKDKIFKKRFVLFDDVWTTGATIKECGRVLKMKGASQVWGLTICR